MIGEGFPSKVEELAVHLILACDDKASVASYKSVTYR